MSTGETLDVPHPEMLIVAKDIVAVGIPDLDDNPPDVSRLVWIDLEHIVHLQPLTSAAA